MKTKMEQLQADMMTKGAFTRYERRQMKYLTKANEAQRQYVKSALPSKHLARSWMEECGEVDDYGNIYYCGVPLCPRCFMRERAVQTGKAIKKIFCDAANEDLAFATILLPTQLDFSGMTVLVENEKRRLRTFVDRQRKKDNRWDEFQLLGWWEIDRMSFGDFETCGRNTKIALDGLGFPLMETPDKTIWRPHLHAIIRKGGLTTEEIAGALRKETHTAKYQVDIQPFRAHRDVGDNIQNIVRYCLKFRIECDYKRPDAQDFIEAENADEAKPIVRQWWPVEDVREYVDWLCVQRSGFQSLRFVIGQAKEASTGQVKGSAFSSVSITKKTINGEKSISSISDRSHSPADLHVVNANSLISELSGIFVVEDNDVASTGIADGVAGKGLTRCMYNNNIKDTNWTGTSSDTPLTVIETQPAVAELDAASKISRYPVNAISLSDRVRGILAQKQANRDHVGGMKQL
ncbi:MAG: hypothetical protein ACK4UW_00525 [Rhizobium rhizophilum]|uniref:hypothetical protein n=1 Tax=Rhizobium rhizophilum TaxID=1850373 RepID=UPI00391AE2B4